MATVSRGKTFTSTETVTNTKLHQLVDSATVTAIDRADANTATTSFITKSSTVPTSPTDDELWFDTTLNILRRYDLANTVWVPVARGSIMTNKSGGSVTQYFCVVVDTTTDVSFTTTTTDSDDTVIGVAAETIADDAKGVILHRGITKCRVVAGGVSLGNYAKASTTAGKAGADGTKSIYNFGTFLAAGAGDTDVDILLFM